MSPKALYKIKKPSISGKEKEKVFKLLLSDRGSSIIESVLKTYAPKYLYWDTIKYKELPKNLTNKEFWAAVKIFRQTQSVKTLIKSENGEHFTLSKLPQLEEFLHTLDLHTGGSLFAFTKDIDEQNKYKFISRGIMEEAIASSQLEGAITSRRVAKQFLREGRKPKNKSEQMILNNYLTMQAVEEEYKNQKLNLDLLFELHAMITKNTVKEDEVGRLREDKDDIVVSDDEFIYHIPPKNSFLKIEIQRLIRFANDELETPFIHPVIKAIMLHFWIGYLHPFTDGNGRLARLLFYWYLLRKDYWAFAYLPISKVIKKSPVQYRDAYLFSEQDDLDMTYFLDYNIRKIALAVEEFKRYLEKKSSMNRAMNELSRSKYKLNDRQIHLLQYLHENKDEKTSPSIHMRINQVSKMTAIKDLKKLQGFNFIIPKKQGRNVYYYPTDKIKELFK